LDNEAIQVVRGSAVRTLRTLGGGLAIVISLPILGLWLIAKSSSTTKIVVSVLILVFAGIVLLCACVASSFAIAEIRNRRLNFYFCGVRTRSILLNDSTIFELRKMGRLKVLCIQSSGSTYVPNGALDISDVVDLLRANGVAERKAV
jgi:hypothetical protein